MRAAFLLVLALAVPAGARVRATTSVVRQVIPGRGDQLLLTSDGVVPVLITVPARRQATTLTLTVGRTRRLSRWVTRVGEATEVRFPTSLPLPDLNKIPLALTLPSGRSLYRAGLPVRLSNLRIDHSPSPDMDGLRNALQVVTVGPSLHSPENAFQLGYTVDGTSPVFARLSLSNPKHPERTNRFWLALKPGQGKIDLDVSTLCNLAAFDKSVRLSGALYDADGNVLTADQVLAVFP